jgi:hypothetical protein
MPKKAREEMRNRNATKDKAREEFAKFLSKKLNRNIDKTSPDIKKFEMFLELNYTKEAFEGNIKGQISLKEIKDFFKLKIPSDKTKYYLWLECNRMDPYEGKTIRLSDLFSPSVEIEHIIPYSICGDNSFLNKTLSFKGFNAIKGNKTPIQYFEDKPNEKRSFEKRIAKSHFSDAKRDRFLMPTNKIDQFRNSQLNNTAYIGTEVRKHLLKSFLNKDIEITNGKMTSLIRRFLGFNGILNEPVQVSELFRNMGKVWAVINDKREIVDYLPREDDSEPNNLKVIKGVINFQTFYPSKLRDDHRHHAVDALVTALINKKISNSMLSCTEGYVDFNTGEYYSKYFTDENGEHRLTREAIGQIKEKLREELSLSELDELLPKAKEKIKQILVSYKNEKLNSLVRKKLFEPNGKQKTINKNGEIYQLRSSGLGVRHELHEANFYGKTNDCKPNEYVKRVKLSFGKSGNYFKQESHFENIVDKGVRDAIISKINECALKYAKEKLIPFNISMVDFREIRKKLDSSNQGLIDLKSEEQKFRKEIKKKQEKLYGIKTSFAKQERKNLQLLIKEFLKNINFQKHIKEMEIDNNKNELNKYEATYNKLFVIGAKIASQEGFRLKNEGKRQKRKGKSNSFIQREDIPIKKVRIKYISNTAIPVKSKSQIINITPQSQKVIDESQYQYVLPGNNYSFIIYGNDYNDENKKYHVVTWFDKARIDQENIRRKKDSKELKSYYPKTKDGLPFLIQLSHKDLVIAFNENEDVSNISIDKNELFNRIFVVNDFDQSGKIIFTRHNKCLNATATKASSVGNNILLGDGEVLRRHHDTFKGIPVRIDILGNLL